VNVTTETNNTHRDLARFRKTYASTRQQPVRSRALVIEPILILTEDGDFLTTEDGDLLEIEE